MIIMTMTMMNMIMVTRALWHKQCKYNIIIHYVCVCVFSPAKILLMAQDQTQ